MTMPPSLLIVHQGALGDLVCIFPIIALLRHHFRPVAMLCQGHLGRLAKAERLVDAWFPIEAAWAASLFTSNPAPKARDAFASYSHILLFSKSEILVSALQKIAGACIGRVSPRPPAGRRVHMAEYALGCIREWGWLPPSATATKPVMESPPGPRRAVAENFGSQTILLHPGAGSPRKRWPLRGFLELAALINTCRLSPEFVIGPADHDLLPELVDRGAAVHQPVDCLDLLKLCRTAAAYVGNDSGASHLAAWTHLPSVVIFGPSDPERWRPMGRNVEIVQTPCDCTPCFETEAANCGAGTCLSSTAPRVVLEALVRLIGIGPADTSAGPIPIFRQPG
jgi:hypothetical protein